MILNSAANCMSFLHACWLSKCEGFVNQTSCIVMAVLQHGTIDHTTNLDQTLQHFYFTAQVDVELYQPRSQAPGNYRAPGNETRTLHNKGIAGYTCGCYKTENQPSIHDITTAKFMISMKSIIDITSKSA